MFRGTFGHNQYAWPWTPQPTLIVGPTEVISAAGQPVVQPTVNPTGVSGQQQPGTLWFRSGTPGR